MKIVIATQYLENYGAHDWDGHGECPQYWKPKGGDTYVIKDLTQEQVQAFEANHLDKVYSLIQYNNEYAQEYILGYQVAEDNAVVCDSWESPKFITLDEDKFIANSVTKNDEYAFMHQSIAEKQESYVMLEEGKRENYQLSFLLKDGQLIPNENIMQYLT